MPNFNDFDLDVQNDKISDSHYLLQIRTIACETEYCITFSTPATVCRDCNTIA